MTKKTYSSNAHLCNGGVYDCIVNGKVLGCMVKLQDLLGWQGAAGGAAWTQRLVEGAAGGCSAPDTMLSRIKYSAADAVGCELQSTCQSGEAATNDGDVGGWWKWACEVGACKGLGGSIACRLLGTLLRRA